MFGNTSYCEEEIKRNDWGENHAIFANPFVFIGVAFWAQTQNLITNLSLTQAGVWGALGDFIGP